MMSRETARSDRGVGMAEWNSLPCMVCGQEVNLSNGEHRWIGDELIAVTCDECANARERMLNRTGDPGDQNEQDAPTFSVKLDGLSYLPGETEPTLRLHHEFTVAGRVAATAGMYVTGIDDIVDAVTTLAWGELSPGITHVYTQLENLNRVLFDGITPIIHAAASFKAFLHDTTSKGFRITNMWTAEEGYIGVELTAPNGSLYLHSQAPDEYGKD